MKKLLIIALLFACSDDDSPTLTTAGNWTGHYIAGQYEGTVQFTVGEQGEVDGFATSKIGKYTLVGNVQCDILRINAGHSHYPTRGFSVSGETLDNCTRIWDGIHIEAEQGSFVVKKD